MKQDLKMIICFFYYMGKREELYIGFHEVPTDITACLEENGYTPYTPKNRSFSRGSQEKGISYRCTDQRSGGIVSVLYQAGKDMEEQYKPNLEDLSIHALLKVTIFKEVIGGSNDSSLVQCRDALIDAVLKKYSDSAFQYVLASNDDSQPILKQFIS